MFTNIWPLVITLRKKLQKAQNSDVDGAKALKDVFTLSCSQIKKCVLGLFEVFKIEYHEDLFLQVSQILLLRWNDKFKVSQGIRFPS